MLVCKAHPVEKATVPDNIERLMKEWRQGFRSMPRQYIDFHKDLAEKRLEHLRSVYGFRVIEAALRNSGWFDGMRELNAIIETRKGKLRRLKWCDSNQDFFLAHEVGGSGIFDEDELN